MSTAKESSKKLHVVIACLYLVFLVVVCFTDLPKKGLLNWLVQGDTIISPKEKAEIVVLNLLFIVANFLFLEGSTKEKIIIKLIAAILLISCSLASAFKTLDFPAWVILGNAFFLAVIFILTLISFKSSNKHKK